MKSTSSKHSTFNLLFIPHWHSLWTLLAYWPAKSRCKVEPVQRSPVGSYPNASPSIINMRRWRFNSSALVFGITNFSHRQIFRGNKCLKKNNIKMAITWINKYSSKHKPSDKGNIQVKPRYLALLTNCLEFHKGKKCNLIACRNVLSSTCTSRRWFNS